MLKYMLKLNSLNWSDISFNQTILENNKATNIYLPNVATQKQGQPRNSVG